jgi:hypothetical protein
VKIILGIDPAEHTGFALRKCNDAGHTINGTVRVAECRIVTAEQAEDAFTHFLGLSMPDLVVIEGMYVGPSARGSVSLADLAGWFEMLSAHYFPGTPRYRPMANQWRPCCNISCKKENDPKGLAIQFAQGYGLTLPTRTITKGKNKGKVETAHNAAEAFCMTFYTPKVDR